jgi:hypothetical protein
MKAFKAGVFLFLPLERSVTGYSPFHFIFILSRHHFFYYFLLPLNKGCDNIFYLFILTIALFLYSQFLFAVPTWYCMLLCKTSILKFIKFKPFVLEAPNHLSKLCSSQCISI